MKKSLLLILIILSILLTFCNQKEDGKVYLQITKDYGKEVISETTIPFINGKTVMDALAENFDVKTSYGGGFVESIDGLKTKLNSDGQGGIGWIYYVNGEEATIGAADYLIKKGDKIRWDLHKWDMESLSKNNQN